jgi:hypothetical protein
LVRRADLSRTNLEGMRTSIRGHAIALVATAMLAGCTSAGGGPGGPSREDPNRAPDDITAMVTCFRAHGMPEWPDPNYDPRDGRWHLDGPPLKAETRQACASVIPHQAPPQPIPSEQFHDLLQYAQCLRANGIAAWPDPGVDGVFVTNIDPKQDPAFAAAGPPCEKYLASSGGHLDIRHADG